MLISTDCNKGLCWDKLSVKSNGHVCVYMGKIFEDRVKRCITDAVRFIHMYPPAAGRTKKQTDFN